ncbi:hypothetical protein J6590_029855 [Homalodisca vitripennis]|nr:hypothetical protein J6590_029855 [Homalodisca vitripennis]
MFLCQPIVTHLSFESLLRTPISVYGFSSCTNRRKQPIKTTLAQTTKGGVVLPCYCRTVNDQSSCPSHNLHTRSSVKVLH